MLFSDSQFESTSALTRGIRSRSIPNQTRTLQITDLHIEFRQESWTSHKADLVVENLEPEPKPV